MAAKLLPRIKTGAGIARSLRGRFISPIKPGADSGFCKRTDFRSRTMRSTLFGMQGELL